MARPHRALLDTNLLLLWLAARVNPRLLSSFKRVQAFTLLDIDLLREQLLPFREQITTPHILSETSNFIDQAPQVYRKALLDELRLFVHEMAEVYMPARILVETDGFESLGLTDSAIVQMSDNVVILTVDFRLSGKILALGGNVINFNHQRSAYLTRN